MIKEEDILNGEPINGHIVIKIDKKDLRESLGMSEDSTIELPDTVEQAYTMGSNRGIVVKMASDAFGSMYKEKYGNEINPPNIGDIVHFVPYQSNKMDKKGEYYLITDDGVKFIERRGA